MQWRTDAACRGADPTLFDERDSHTRHDWARLQVTVELFCADCPVQTRCGEFARTHRLSGVYGGVYRHTRHGRLRHRTLLPATLRMAS